MTRCYGNIIVVVELDSQLQEEIYELSCKSSGCSITVDYT